MKIVNEAISKKEASVVNGEVISRKASTTGNVDVLEQSQTVDSLTLSNAQDALADISAPLPYQGFEESGVFNIFMVIPDLIKTYSAQLAVTGDLVGQSTAISKKVESYMSRLSGAMTQQSADQTELRKLMPSLVDRIIEQAAMLVFGAFLGAGFGGLALALIGASVTALNDVMQDVPMKKNADGKWVGGTEKDNQGNLWDAMLSGLPEKAQGATKLGITLGLTALAIFIGAGAMGAFTGVAAEEAGAAVEEGSEVAEQASAKIADAQWKLKSVFIGLNTFSTEMGGITSLNKKGEQVTFWADFFGNKAGGAIAESLSIGFMLLNFVLGFKLASSTASAAVSSSEAFNRVFKAGTIVSTLGEGATQGINGVRQGREAHYDRKLSVESAIVTKLEKDQAMLALIKQALSTSIKATEKRLGGIMNSLIAAIESYTTQLSTGA